jgi:hypothetical protein
VRPTAVGRDGVIGLLLFSAVVFSVLITLLDAKDRYSGPAQNSHPINVSAVNDMIIIFGSLLDTPASPLNDPISQVHPSFKLTSVVTASVTESCPTSTRHSLLHMKFVKG